MAVGRAVLFTLLFIAPGDPALGDRGRSGDARADVEAHPPYSGSTGPFLLQCSEWAWRLLHADLGRSIFHQPAGHRLIAQRIEPTLSLMVITGCCRSCLRVPIGVLAAWKAGPGSTPRRDGVRGVRLFGAGVRGRYLPRVPVRASAQWLPVQGSPRSARALAVARKPDRPLDRARLRLLALIAPHTRARPCLKCCNRLQSARRVPRPSGSARSCSSCMLLKNRLRSDVTGIGHRHRAA